MGRPKKKSRTVGLSRAVIKQHRESCRGKHLDIVGEVPVELKLLIFRKLGLCSTLGRIACVSKHWRTFVDDPLPFARFLNENGLTDSKVLVGKNACEKWKMLRRFQRDKNPVEIWNMCDAPLCRFIMREEPYLLAISSNMNFNAEKAGSRYDVDFLIAFKHIPRVCDTFLLGAARAGHVDALERFSDEYNRSSNWYSITQLASENIESLKVCFKVLDAEKFYIPATTIIKHGTITDWNDLIPPLHNSQGKRDSLVSAIFDFMRVEAILFFLPKFKEMDPDRRGLQHKYPTSKWIRCLVEDDQGLLALQTIHECGYIIPFDSLFIMICQCGTPELYRYVISEMGFRSSLGASELAAVHGNYEVMRVSYELTAIKRWPRMREQCDNLECAQFLIGRGLPKEQRYFSDRVKETIEQLEFEERIWRI